MSSHLCQTPSLAHRGVIGSWRRVSLSAGEVQAVQGESTVIRSEQNSLSEILIREPGDLDFFIWLKRAEILLEQHVFCKV